MAILVTGEVQEVIFTIHADRFEHLTANHASRCRDPVNTSRCILLPATGLRQICRFNPVSPDDTDMLGFVIHETTYEPGDRSGRYLGVVIERQDVLCSAGQRGTYAYVYGR